MQDEGEFNLSVSIVCFNSSQAELHSLLSSLASAVQRLRACYSSMRIPVYLIDNADSPTLSLECFAGLSGRLADQDMELELLQGHGNIGYGRGHNLALERLESSYHLILNPDIELAEDCLVEAASYLLNNRHVALASPAALFENGNKQFLCKRYPSVLTFLIRGFLPNMLRAPFSRRLAKYEMHDLSESEATTGVPIVSGCFMLCRTDALKQIGGFDEGYFLYFEDFDLSLRMGRIADVAYVPAMRIQHAGGYAARKGLAHLRMFIRSGLRFFNTHGWRFFRQAG